MSRPISVDQFSAHAFTLGDEFLPGTVTGESLVWVRCGEGELTPERLQAEVLLLRGSKL